MRMLRLLVRCSCLIAVAMMLSGCFLRLLFGAVGQRDTDFGIVFIARLGGTFGPLATCGLDQETGRMIECDYSFFDVEADGAFVTTSTAELVSQFGVLGVVVDPLILQVPAAAKNAAATLDDGSGARPLVIEETSAFLAQPGTEIRAEAGQKFLILDLPAELLARLSAGETLEGPFDFQLEFEVPALEVVPVKAMFTAKVEANGQTYYAPLLPCVTDFASIPVIRLPVFERPGLLTPQLVFALRRNPDLGCRGKRYDFRPDAGSTPGRVFLPLLSP